MSELIQDVEWYLDRLEGVEGGQGEWTAWCPCHDDYGTEWKGLSVSQKKGKLLAKCHSCGATLPQIMDALDDVDPDERREDVPTVHITRVHANGNGDAEAVAVNGGRGITWWVGKTGVAEDVWASLGCESWEQGVRFTFHHDPAIFKGRKPPKDIVWIGTDGPSAPPLWPYPDDKLPEHVAITEGESDCGTAAAANLADACFAATKGSKAPLPSGWAQSLKDRGVRRLTVVGDTDEGGIAFRDRLAREAVAAGLAVEIVRLETILDPFSGINDLNGVWKACETVEEFTEAVGRATQKVAERVMFKSVGEMEKIAEQKIDWIIPDLIAPGDKVLLTAPQKSLKSWISLELTRSLVTGAPFLQRAEWVPKKKRRVGYMQEEGSPALWARRIYMLSITGNKNAVFSHRTGFSFTDDAMVDEVISAVRELNLDVLIFDPMQRMMSGIENENDNSQVGIVWDQVFRIQQALPHLVVMIVHHANRTGALGWTAVRGASRHGGEVDLGIFIEKHPIDKHTLRLNLDGRDIPEYLGNGEVFEVKYEIDREARKVSFDATEMAINITSPGQNVGKANRDKVLQAVNSGRSTRKEILLETGLSDNTLKEHLLALAEEGAIEVVDQGKGKVKLYQPKQEAA